MANLFQLVVNFDDNIEDARAAALIGPQTLRAGSHRIPIHPASMSLPPACIEFCLRPVGVSRGGGLDGAMPRLRLSPSELSELGTELYRLLATFSGYQAAIVGWDLESLVETHVIKSDLADDVARGIVNGLVLCQALYDEVAPGGDWVEFQPGYVWIPYRGEERGTHGAA
jgi:hypothetical protein